MLPATRFVEEQPLKRPLLPSVIIIALTVPAPAATDTTDAARPKPCPKGQILLTSKITGDRYCAAMGGIRVTGGGPQPIMVPARPARKP